jgi:hypothetical protein
MVSGQRFIVHPQNDMYKDLTLYAFVTDLKMIIATHNDKALMGIIDSNIKLSFGDYQGIADFRRTWMLDRTETPIWSNLSRLIRVGGTMDAKGETVCFPYLFAASIPDSVDLIKVFFVTGDHVAIRSRPDSSSRIIGYLGDEIVYRSGDTLPVAPCKNKRHAHYFQAGERQDWVAVTTFDHQVTGYVYWDYLWSPFDYRMFVSRRNGKWKITCLISGE